MKSQRNVWIQLFRIIACFSVFIVHLGQRLYLEGTIREFTEFGSYGVQLFFIISGFLAAKGLVKNETKLVYYKKRMISLLPLYYYIMIFWYFVTENIVDMYYHHIPVDPAGLGWFRYLFLLNGFIIGTDYFWNNLGITWTIPVFVFFYFIAPFVMKFIKKYWHSFIVLALSSIVCFVIYKYYPCSIAGNLSYFFLGICVYYCLQDNKLYLCAFLFILFFIVFSIVGVTSYALLFATMLAVVVDKKIVLSNKLQKIIDILDEHSFALYLVHGMIFCSIIDRRFLFQIPMTRKVIFFIAVVGSFIGTIIMHKYVEKPIQKFLKKKMNV